MSVDGLSPEALELLRRYHWPGNVRELQNEIQRMLVMSGGEGRLGPQLLSGRILGHAPMEQGEMPNRATLKQRVEAMEAGILSETLSRHRWNKSRAAEELGLSRVGLRAKLERYRLIADQED